MEYPCISCSINIRPRQQALECDWCNRRQHRTCNSGISIKTYREAVKMGGATFICQQCRSMERPLEPSIQVEVHTSESDGEDPPVLELSVPFDMTFQNHEVEEEPPALEPSLPISYIYLEETLVDSQTPEYLQETIDETIEVSHEWEPIADSTAIFAVELGQAGQQAYDGSFDIDSFEDGQDADSFNVENPGSFNISDRNVDVVNPITESISHYYPNMMKPAPSFVVLLTILMVLLNPSNCNNVQLELFRTYCPLSNFCTVGSLRAQQGKDTSCCMDCSCDVYCYAYGDCCPDVDLLRPRPQNQTAPIPCESVTYVPNNSYPNGESIKRYTLKYSMINHCPDDFTDENGTVDKCLWNGPDFPAEFDDVTAVSDSRNVLYRNKHCALCQGVREFTRWDLELYDCRDPLHEMQFKSSEVTAYMLQNCVLKAVRPTSIGLSSRFWVCNRIVKSVCPPLSGDNDDITDACENGPFMPFTTDNNIFYKNVLCYRCHHLDDSAEFCPLEHSWHDNRGGYEGLSNLLAFDTTATVKPNSKCDESEMFDYYTNECRVVYCPPYQAVSHGSCQPITTLSSVGAILRIVFRPTDTVLTVNQPIQLYNESLNDFYVSRFREIYKDINCESFKFGVYLHSERSSQKFVYIEVETEISFNSNCSIKEVGQFVRKHTAFAVTWVIKENSVKMNGYFTFFETQSQNSLDTRKDYLILFRGVDNGALILKQFVVCPYFVFDLDMYRRFRNRTDVNCGERLLEFSMFTETIAGTYALSENKMAVCVDAYMQGWNMAVGLFSGISSLIVTLMNISLLLIM